jgi:hypothetical protein
MLAFLRARGNKGVNEEELNHLFEFIEEVYSNMSCIRLVLDGNALIDIQKGAVVFLSTRLKK